MIVPSKLFAAVTAWISPVKCKLNWNTIENQGNVKTMCAYLVHGNNLAVTSTSGTTLDAKGWTLAGLTDASESGTTEMCTKGLSKTDGGRGLAFTKGRWGDTKEISENWFENC